MPESNVDVVRQFYTAVADKDGAALADLVALRFGVDAEIEWPKSLPYGGKVAGANRLAKMFGQMAAAPAPVGPARLLLIDVVDGGDKVAAELEFDWYAPGSSQPVRSGALELWTFADGLVRSIRAYYWDTAEVLKPVGVSG